MKSRKWVLALWCGVLLLAAMPAQAKKYRLVQDMTGQWYIIDKGDSFWEKITNPLGWIRSHSLKWRPPGFGGAITQREMSEQPNAMEQAQSATYQVGTGMSRLPFVGRFGRKVTTWSNDMPNGSR